MTLVLNCSINMKQHLTVESEVRHAGVKVKNIIQRLASNNKDNLNVFPRLSFAAIPIPLIQVDLSVIILYFQYLLVIATATKTHSFSFVQTHMPETHLDVKPGASRPLDGTPLAL